MVLGILGRRPGVHERGRDRWDGARLVRSQGCAARGRPRGGNPSSHRTLARRETGGGGVPGSREGTADIWTIDVARGIGTRQTSDKGWDYDPVWSPDGRELVFTSNRENGFQLYRKALQGDQPEKRLAKALETVWPESWTPDGKALIVLRDQKTILALPWPEEGQPETIIQRGYAMDEPQVSPDGRWLAYIAEESGRWDVYVEPFRRPGQRIRISPEGGGQPKWRADGKELFYVTPDGRLMSVQVKATADRLEVTLPVALFSGVISGPVWDRYVVTRDGQRFLVVVPTGGGVQRIHVVTNWTSLLAPRTR